MKNKILLIILFGVMIYAFNACKESSTTENPQGDPVADTSYYPVSDGSYYKYTITRDSSSSQTNGERVTYYNGTGIKGNVNYQVQIDTLTLAGQSIPPTISYFRRTDTGVFFFLDTTGLSASVPGIDTLLQYLTIDSEMRLLLLPVYDNSNWTVFKMNLNYQGVINFNPVELTAVYDGKETLTLNLNPSENVECVRLKFNLKYRSSPFNPTQEFSPAYGWIAKGIGIVQWQGNGTIVGVFSGNGIDFDDSSSVFTQNLIDYRIGN
jgi:hypothetical protein